MIQYVLTVVVCSLCQQTDNPRTQMSVAFDSMSKCMAWQELWQNDEDVRILEVCHEEA
jgi:hypothetical protein|tara:strand:- start:752 stop:925 length:174 start_codon:yes stop_codon:yes gene_type:complete